MRLERTTSTREALTDHFEDEEYPGVRALTIDECSLNVEHFLNSTGVAVLEDVSGPEVRSRHLDHRHVSGATPATDDRRRRVTFDG